MREINTKVVGTTFHVKNWDELKPGAALVLVCEPLNPYDTNAVRVDSLSGQKLGYVTKNKDLAQRVFRALQKGAVVCSVIEVTGGGEKNHGINIHISLPEV